jgi:hypothetical protein
MKSRSTLTRAFLNDNSTLRPACTARSNKARGIFYPEEKKGKKF